MTMILIGVCACSSTLLAGEMYWSPVPGLNNVNEFAVCGTTVYAATETGLYRCDGNPSVWTQLRTNWIKQVACSGAKVIWLEIIDITPTAFVSHDALETITPVIGLEGDASSGIRDLAIAGNIALSTTLWGVSRSTDGGFNFPSAYPVLWDGSGGYQLTAVWTNGAACAAAGSGGMAGNGIWRSPTGDVDTWIKVLDTGGQSWLSGSGNSTIVSGNVYSGTLSNGYISTDAGASWTQLPLSWVGGTGGFYQRPFVSETRIFSRYVYEVFDPGSGQFIVYTNGPYYYDTDTGIGNDLDPSFYSEAELYNQAIVETTAPFLLVAEREGSVYWFQVPGGWPADGFDFTPPISPSLEATPRVVARPPASAATLFPSAYGDPAWMYIAELYDRLTVSYAAGGFHSSLDKIWGASTDGWQTFSTIPIDWTLYPGDGSHTFYAWYSDAAGNMTDPAVGSGTTAFPANLELIAEGAWGTWMYAETGESFTIATSGFLGDIDIFHWEPPGSGSPNDWAMSYDNDTLSFTAASSGFHLVILWNYPSGAGTFQGTVTVQEGSRSGPFNVPNRDKPLPNSEATPYDDSPLPLTELPEATVIFIDGFESGDPENWS